MSRSIPTCGKLPVSPCRETGEQLAGLAVDPTDGTLYASTGGGAVNPSSIYRVNKASGAIALIGNVGVATPNGAIPDITFDAAGQMYGVIGSGGAGGTFIEAARPNPFGAATELRFALERSGPVTIEVFNVLGQRVTTLTNGPLEAGEHFVRWSGLDNGGRPVADGIYYARMRAGEVTESRAVVRIR